MVSARLKCDSKDSRGRDDEKQDQAGGDDSREGKIKAAEVKDEVEEGGPAMIRNPSEVSVWANHFTVLQSWHLISQKTSDLSKNLPFRQSGSDCFFSPNEK